MKRRLADRAPTTPPLRWLFAGIACALAAAAGRVGANPFGGTAVSLRPTLSHLTTESDVPDSSLFGRHGGPVARIPVPGLATLDANDCARCHADVASEWAASRHAQSATDPVFVAELAETTDRAPCFDCHSPTSATRPPEPTAVQAGIDCATCHVRDGHVLTAGPERSVAEHPMRHADELARSEFCAGCHDFPFPEVRGLRGLHYANDELQQATYREWTTSTSGRAGMPCAGCHMPSVARPNGRVGRSHAFPGLDDPAFVRPVVVVSDATVRRGGRPLAQLTLVARGVGHRVPSGDIFRVLRVQITDDLGVVGERRLARSIRPVGDGHARALRTVRDDRLEPDRPMRLAIPLRRTHGAVRYEVALFRTVPEAALRRGLAESQVRVPLAEGEFGMRATEARPTVETP